MANIANLAVQLTAKTGMFSKNMKGATKDVSGFQKITDFASRRLALFATAAVGAATAAIYGAARAVRALVKEQLQLIDRVAKTSDTLGIQTEWLKSFHYAASLAGISTETFDMALQRMVRRVSEAAKGTGEAQGALKELRLDAWKLARMPVHQQFLTIAKAMQQVTRQNDRVRLSMKLFDSEGVKLVRLLNQGEEGLMAIAEEAKKLGIVFNRFDAAKVEAANDAVTRLKGAITGLKQQITIAAAPAIESFADSLSQVAVDIEPLNKALKNHGTVLDDIILKWKTVKAMGKGTPFQRMQHLWPILGMLPKGVGDVLQPRSINKDIKSQTDALSDYAEEMNNVAEATEGAAKATFLHQKRMNTVGWFGEKTFGGYKKKDFGAIADAMKQTFSQVRRAEMAINTPLNRAIYNAQQRAGRAQRTEVHDPNVEVTNRILEQVRRRLDSGVPAVAQ